MLIKVNVKKGGIMNERTLGKENILGTEKVAKLLFKFGVPGAVAMVVNSLYNIVDQIFIGQGVGYLGNAATNVVYPLSVFVLAVAALMGDGAAAYMSLKLGQNYINRCSICICLRGLWKHYQGRWKAKARHGGAVNWLCFEYHT
jgi:hypothetical protein